MNLVQWLPLLKRWGKVLLVLFVAAFIVFAVLAFAGVTLFNASYFANASTWS